MIVATKPIPSLKSGLQWSVMKYSQRASEWKQLMLFLGPQALSFHTSAIVLPHYFLYTV